MKIKKDKKIKVDKCVNCPFIKEYEDTFMCGIDEDERDIKIDSHNMPIMPYWCNLKINNIVVVQE